MDIKSSNISAYYGDDIGPYPPNQPLYTGYWSSIHNVHIKIPNGSIANTKKRTITYKNDMQFYMLDTSFILEGQKDKNVYIKSNSNSKIITERYRFYKKKADRLSVTYKYNEGFVVSNFASGYGNISWYNGTLENVNDYSSGEGRILWKTKLMADWNVTTPTKINNDIPIKHYEENGTVLYFMDANNPVYIVKVKIPAVPKEPSISYKISGTKYLLSSFISGKIQFRVFDSSLLTSGAAITYRSIPANIGKVDSDGWYDYVGTEKELDLCSLAGITTNEKQNKLPGLCIEIRLKETSQNAASAITTIIVNPQEVMNMPASAKVRIKAGLLTVSDATTSNQYEYKVSGMDKWNVIRNQKVRDKSIQPGCTILLRKKELKKIDGGIVFPSTYVSLAYNGTKESTLVYSAEDIASLIAN